MKIHVSREQQEVIVPRGHKTYLFGRCSDCKQFCCVANADIHQMTEDAPTNEGEGKIAYNVMEIPEDGNLSYLLTMTEQYDTVMEMSGYSDELQALETDISEKAEQVFAPYLQVIQ